MIDGFKPLFSITYAILTSVDWINHFELQIIIQRLKINRSDSIQQLNTTRSQISILGIYLKKVALLSYAGLIITSPIRYRTILIERPIPGIYREYTDVLLYASDVFLIVTLCAWFSSVLMTKEKINFGPEFITWPLFGLLVCSLISIISSVEPYLSGYNATRLILYTLMYFYVINEIRSLAQIILPIAIMVFVQSTIGLGQVLNQASLGLRILGELDLNPEWNGISVITNEGLRSLRAYGLTDHPNILGGCLALGLVLLMSWSGISNRKWAPIIYGVFMLGVVVLFLTYSRSAWLALSIAMLFFFSLVVRKKLRSALNNSTNLIVASTIILTPFIWTNLDLLGIRFNFRNSFERVPQEQQSIGERLLLNQEGNKIFSSSPITGIGLSAFPYALARSNPEFPVDYQPAHFVLLDVAAETGIFGGLFFAILITSPWIMLWLNRRRIDFSVSLIGVSSLLLIITIIGLFDYYPWMLAAGRIWQWMAWGLWGTVYLSSKK